MKKIAIIFLINSLRFHFLTAQVPNGFNWGSAFGGAGNDLSRAVATDSNNNTYYVGSFTGVVDFNPGAGVFNMTPVGSADCFIVKLDGNGNFSWAKRVGGTGATTVPLGIAVDNAGNVYFTGYFTASADFDPGAGAVTLTSAGSTDIFVCKLNSVGNYVWAVSAGGSGLESINTIALDASGNPHLTGQFLNTVDFDPGAGVNNLTAVGAADVFVWKLSSAGTYVWAKSFGGTSSDAGFGLALDAAGNVFTAGNFNGTVDFDPGVGTATIASVAANTDVFISKLDVNGNYLWASAISGTSTQTAIDLDLGVAGNTVYVFGNYTGVTDFDPGVGTATLTDAGGSDLFLCALTATAGGYLWCASTGTNTAETANGASVDGSGNIYLTGTFRGTVDFDPGASVNNLVSTGNTDIFIVELTPTGNFIWAGAIGGTANDTPTGIAAYTSGLCFVATGYFLSPTMDLNMGAGVSSVSRVALEDGYIVRYCDLAAVLPIELKSFEANCESGITLNWQTASEKNNSHFEVEYSLDGLNFNATGDKIPSAKNSNGLNTYRFLFEPAQDSVKYAEVLYFRLKQVDLDGSAEYSKIIFSKCANSFDEAFIYPNPASGMFYVYCNHQEDLSSLTLFDAYGKKYPIATSPEGKTKIRVEPLDVLPGMYYFKYNGVGGSKIFKILIEN